MTNAATADALGKTTGWSMVWGVLMLICGMLAIALPRISSLEIVIILAWLLLIVGVWHLIFAFHAQSTGGVLWQILLAVLYGIAGVYMWVHPLLSVVSLTLVIAIFFALEGVLEIILSFALRGIRHAGWVLVDGIVTLILGILIWKQWPSSSTWVIGTLVGISLIFSGISRFLLASSARGPKPVAL
ncbi:MAG: DUF308 domain-containing protein [Chthoniobacterales bacterium]